MNIEPLVKCLNGNDNDQAQVIQVIRAFGGIKAYGAVKPLINLLHTHEDISVKREAILALGKMGYHDAVKPLIDIIMSKEADKSLKDAAVWALGKIDSSSWKVNQPWL